MTLLNEQARIVTKERFIETIISEISEELMTEFCKALDAKDTDMVLRLCNRRQGLVDIAQNIRAKAEAFRR